MIKVLFFAKLREQVGCTEMELPALGAESSVAALLDAVIAELPSAESALKQGNVLAAINQEMAPLTATVVDGDEVAFFPPVTGG
ncbi:Molybdopterin converting factor, small subunit [Hahella chejuensis KCTC 2396]|uniref:Molybdopterin synthase sulfur carrier subunit n=1 Tax=Hahella chejuensis (strain KCTC 2396) TaxID=349521 RepID=Q2SA05_HAHCH|nr:molybdopterin converting factor subunit 1 [Hahella chejuensis]ABC32519.1 Molybdopterin converting factor, small subunit [Hahella chejuensis KCTC 2396]